MPNDEKRNQGERTGDREGDRSPLASKNISNSSPKELVDDFRHEMHVIEEQLRRLGSQEGELPESSRRKIAELSARLESLQSKAREYPGIAQALDLEVREAVGPRETVSLVEEREREFLTVRPEDREREILPMLRSDWPRGTRREEDGTRLVELETLGKVRMRLLSEAQDPVPVMPFQIVAQIGEEEDPVVLRNGYTDAYGYASVSLKNVKVDRVRELYVKVGPSASVDDEHVWRRFDILESQLKSHRDLGLVHTLEIPEAIREGRPTLPPENAESGTIEEPDAADARNSPQSFGLNEEHVDDNCCLRPQKRFPFRQYFFRQVVRVEPPSLIVGTAGASSSGVRNAVLPQRVPIGGPVPYGEESRSDYAIRGGNPLLGYVNLYSQTWYPAGRGLGELIYSLALAPCEEVNLAFIDWVRSQRDTRSELRTESERFQHELHHDRSINEVVDAVLAESQSGSSSAGGGGTSLDLGIFSIGGGGGKTTSQASGRRDIQASTVQNISDQVVQRSSALRSQRATVVTTSVQRESERIHTRTVHNHNRNHAMTVEYFQVVSHYTVKTELLEERPVLLIPYEIDPDIFDKIPRFEKFVLAPDRPITRFLDRNRSVLQAMVPHRFGPAFESLSRLLHCGDVYSIEKPYATFSRWRIALDQAWRPGIDLSIETTDGQSHPLRKVGRGGAGGALEFTSDPVRSDRIAALHVSFDPVESTHSAARRFGGALGGVFDTLNDLLQQSLKHVVKGCEIQVRTDQSRFVPDPQSFRLIADLGQGVTLSDSNPSTDLPLSPPSVSFDGYRGREHKDYCRLKELIAFIQANPMRFMRAIWYHEDPDRRAIRLDRFSFQGDPLFDQIVNRPVGVVGNYVAFPLLEGHRLVPLEEPNYTVDERIITLPTRGVFAEVFLSCCNATEKRDIERTIDPENACQRRAPEITGIQPGSRRDRPDLSPSSFPAPMVNVQAAPGLPDPRGLLSTLGVLGTPNIFRDLTRGAELLQFVNNATKEAFTSTRAHRAAMDKLAGQVLGALLGVPVPGGEGGAASSGTTGITSSTGQDSGVGSQLVSALSGESLRGARPADVYDELQNIQHARERGLLDGDGAREATQNLLAATPAVLAAELGGKDESWYRAQQDTIQILNARLSGEWSLDAKMAWVRLQKYGRIYFKDEPVINLDRTPVPPWVDEADFVASAQADYQAQHDALSASEISDGYSRKAEQILGDMSKSIDAEYFVVHDTADMVDRGPQGTSLQVPDSKAQGIHLWIGKKNLYLQRDWHEAGDGTKIEKSLNHCFLHCELTRAAEAADLETAEQGRQAGTYYTDRQYEDLCNAYVAASLRAGRLLTVTAHRELDRAIKDGHSDPVAFDFERLYELIRTKLQIPGTTGLGITSKRAETANQGEQINAFVRFVDGEVWASDQYGKVRTWYTKRSDDPEHEIKVKNADGKEVGTWYNGSRAVHCGGKGSVVGQYDYDPYAGSSSFQTI